MLSVSFQFDSDSGYIAIVRFNNAFPTCTRCRRSGKELHSYNAWVVRRKFEIFKFYSGLLESISISISVELHCLRPHITSHQNFQNRMKVYYF